ncbi:thioredoxin domain-containing protein [Methanobacterium aggregans]|uniref:thioredoxin domain-containing protein n=1 Tax=Methanobacterium aggregans TaxID=1615586 RepID=UPI001AE1B695|nr:thioredoxin domain-containing protein [Methanobacterium aggregans]MBP2045109.1 uncharacterized protein YyaL (SSP411 family) [Methanobacterium aggregans]
MNGKDNVPEKIYNHLKEEKSPYLIQHAQNPVDWYPWGDEAFEKAKREDKPVFLSIGYSTCHWCHVMAHESFEDPEIGDLINEVFVAVKVDREERPDIDSVYMTICQLMTGSGGWPLTIIMTPDKKPFFAGTYIPKETGYGSVGLRDVVMNVRDLWRDERDELLNSGRQVLRVLEDVSSQTTGDKLDPGTIDKTYYSLSKVFDDENGGFGDFQKFPTPHNLTFLLRYWKRTESKHALQMALKTLDSMSEGGIYDHVGFGFHRYSVDPKWLVPHFEKMLYDQALISMAYIEAFQVTGDQRYRKVAEEIFRYVLRDMKSPEGGFYSAEDADSEGVEGKFYLWKKNEIMDILGPDAELISEVFNIRETGNFGSELTGEHVGANILHIKEPLNNITEKYHVPLEELKTKVESSRLKLFEERRNRVHPHKDDKLLADWNGLMVAALSRASQVFGDPLKGDIYSESAESAMNFILEEMCSGDRLFHRYRDGDAGIPGTLDDYAFVVWGLLELYEALFKPKYLKKAVDLTQTLLKYFWDEGYGGFYFTASDSEQVLLREKKTYDGALPSGNSVQYLNLLKIAKITENQEFELKTREMEQAFSVNVKKAPTAHTQFIEALDFRVGPSYTLVLAGNPFSEDTIRILKNLRKYFIPNKVLILNPIIESQAEIRYRDILGIKDVTESVEIKGMIDGGATLYLCSDKSCNAPTHSLEDVLKLMES